MDNLRKQDKILDGLWKCNVDVIFEKKLTTFQIKPANARQVVLDPNDKIQKLVFGVYKLKEYGHNHLELYKLRQRIYMEPQLCVLPTKPHWIITRMRKIKLRIP